MPVGGRPAGVDGREGGCGTTGGRGIAPVGRPLEITRDSPLGAAGAAGAGVSTTGAGVSTTGVVATGTSTTGVTGVGAITSGVSSTGSASTFAAAAFFAGAFFAAVFLTAVFFAGASPSPDSPSAFLAAAFLAGAFFAGFSSAGCTSRTNPSLTALRRTRSACASSMEEDTFLTSMPISLERSSVSLFVQPSSFASSAIRIFLIAKG